MKVTGLLRLGRLLVAASLLSVTGCGNADHSEVRNEPTIVIVSPPLNQTVPEDVLQVSGWTDASLSVNLRARVPGYLDKINFEPGADVTQGQLLFEIDPRPYQAALEQAQAAVLSFEASAKRAKADLERSQKLLPTGAISKEEYDQYVAKKAEADAGLISAKAKVDAAKLNVEFTKITAPFAGQIGRNLIDLGNLVAADTTELANIVSVDPVFVYFDIDEANALQVHKLLLDGKIQSSKDENTFMVGVQLVGETGFPHEALVNFVDNRLDPNTGTIRMRATLKNPVVANGQRQFGSGLHVGVRIPIGMPYEATLITDRAIMSQQGRKFVYLVDDKNEVVARPVKLGAVKNGMRVIESGLKGDERVIIDGLQMVRPGVKVTPKTPEATPAPAGTPEEAASPPAPTAEAAAAAATK